ncbi:hypothetical protein [Sphingobium indicum]|nr:hypothetical protein [Sphingobium indicum]
MKEYAAAKQNSQTMNGIFAPDVHINTSCVRSWLPRVKLPLLRWTVPRAE